MAYPYGIPSSGFISLPDLNSSAFSPNNVTANISDNHSPVNKRTMVNSHGYQISLLQNFVNKQYLGRENDPVISGFIETLTSNTANITNFIVDSITASSINAVDIVVESGIVMTDPSDICFYNSYDGSNTCYKKDGITMEGFSGGKFDIDVAMASTYKSNGKLTLKSNGGEIHIESYGGTFIAPSGNFYVTPAQNTSINLITSGGVIDIISDTKINVKSPTIFIGENTSSHTHVNGHLSADFLNLPVIDVPSLIVGDIDLGNDIVGEFDSTLCFHSDYDNSNTCYKKDGITMEGYSGGKFDIDIAMASTYKVASTLNLKAGGNLNLTSSASISLHSNAPLNISTEELAPIFITPGGNASIYLTTKSDSPIIMAGGGIQGTFTDNVSLDTSKQLLLTSSEVVSITSPTINIGTASHILYISSAVHGSLIIANDYGSSTITQSEQTGGLFINSDTRNTTLHNNGFIMQSSSTIYLESSNSFEMKAGGAVTITSTSTDQPMVLTASQAITLSSNTLCTIMAGKEIHIEGNGAGQHTIQTVGNIEVRSTAGQSDLTAGTNMYLTAFDGVIGMNTVRSTGGIDVVAEGWEEGSGNNWYSTNNDINITAQGEVNIGTTDEPANPSDTYPITAPDGTTNSNVDTDYVNITGNNIAFRCKGSGSHLEFYVKNVTTGTYEKFQAVITGTGTGATLTFVAP